MPGNKQVNLNGGQGASVWNFKTERLAADLKGADFVSSESILLLASPIAIYNEDALNSAAAVALAQDIQFSQQRQASQIFEIGSRKKYTFSSGRIQGSLRLSRILFDGPSLLKSLTPFVTGTPFTEGANDVWKVGEPEVGDHAGYGNFYMNLGATLFSRPIGIFLVMRDVSEQNIGGVFLEGCYIVSHGLNVSSNQPFVGESADLLFEGVYPFQHREGASLAPDKLIQDA